MNREEYIENVLNELSIFVQEETEQDLFALGWKNKNLGWKSEDVSSIAKLLTTFFCNKTKNIDGDKADIAATLSGIVYDATNGSLPPEALIAVVALKVFKYGVIYVCEEFSFIV
ncbi:hypothetical protein JWG39_10395 [Desulforhopalus vacuolatus]|uniref:hypothetical protein n=1 Tax=Desulforhopalus vacuolatus TaxID=40414 RepID=UPI00196306E3|nr:hypothetical protein [Desulforhopalus vacuolatus]MBM9520222.1 hypothetical protein [Desulforhopalus vacuolatus]